MILESMGFLQGRNRSGRAVIQRTPSLPASNMNGKASSLMETVFGEKVGLVDVV
jgi:hypothetical protein